MKLKYHGPPGALSNRPERFVCRLGATSEHQKLMAHSYRFQEATDLPWPLNEEWWRFWLPDLYRPSSMAAIYRELCR